MTRTRFTGNGETLGFDRFGRDWRFVILEGDEQATVGPYYRTRAELLADLTNYATEYGFPQR